jgi:putative glutamine amidotransferase
VRPIIGITPTSEPAKWGVWDARAVLVPESYVRMVHEAGGRAVCVPPLDEDAANSSAGSTRWCSPAAPTSSRRRYGATAPPANRGPARPRRRRTRRARPALDADLPVLGVCRGMELLAVGLRRDAAPAPARRARQRAAPALARASRRPPGPVRARFPRGGIFGTTAMSTPTTTRPSTDPGSLTVTGWADDGVVEAVEDPPKRFLVGLQWHPEEAADVRPFARWCGRSDATVRTVGFRPTRDGRARLALGVAHFPGAVRCLDR